MCLVDLAGRPEAAGGWNGWSAPPSSGVKRASMGSDGAGAGRAGRAEELGAGGQSRGRAAKQWGGGWGAAQGVATMFLEELLPAPLCFPSVVQVCFGAPRMRAPSKVVVMRPCVSHGLRSCSGVFVWLPCALQLLACQRSWCMHACAGPANLP